MNSFTNTQCLQQLTHETSTIGAFYSQVVHFIQKTRTTHEAEILLELMEKQRCNQLHAIHHQGDDDVQATWRGYVEELQQRLHWKALQDSEENGDGDRFLWEYVESVVRKGLDVNSKPAKPLSLFPWL